MREHSGLKYEVHPVYDPGDPELVNGWLVKVGGGLVQCVTMNAGTVLFIKGPTSTDGKIAMIDPGILNAGALGYSVRELAIGRGRVYMSDYAQLIGQESVPIDAIKPYIEHVAKMRRSYNFELVRTVLDSVLGPEIA